MLKKLVAVIFGALLLAATIIISSSYGYRLGQKGFVLHVHPVHRNFNFITRLPNGLIFNGSVDNRIDKIVLEQGYYEREIVQTLHLVAKYLKARTPSPEVEESMQRELVFLDVGASVGVYTLAMASEVDRIIAVEPYPPLLEKLYNHIKINDLNNVEVLEVGFGNKKEMHKFWIPPDTRPGSGTFAMDRYEFPARLKRKKSETRKQTLKLPVERGDDLLSDVKVDMIKLDAGGYERYVLQGLQDTLNRSRSVMVIELNRNADGGFTSEKELRELLPPDYSIFTYNYRVRPGRECVTPLARRWAQSQHLLVIPNELSDLIDRLVDPDCLSMLNRFFRFGGKENGH
jgi:FkbM family methyltransferase